MVSFSDTEFIILGGDESRGTLSDVTMHSTADDESLDDIMKP